jgi:hypothetical protein
LANQGNGYRHQSAEFGSSRTVHQIKLHFCKRACNARIHGKHRIAFKIILRDEDPAGSKAEECTGVALDGMKSRLVLMVVTSDMGCFSKQDFLVVLDW